MKSHVGEAISRKQDTPAPLNRSTLGPKLFGSIKERIYYVEISSMGICII